MGFLIPLGSRIVPERTAAAKAVKQALVPVHQVGVVVSRERARHRVGQRAGLPPRKKEPADLTLAILAGYQVPAGAKHPHLHR